MKFSDSSVIGAFGSPESETRFDLAKSLHLLHSYSVQRRMLALKILNILKLCCV